MDLLCLTVKMTKTHRSDDMEMIHCPSTFVDVTRTNAPGNDGQVKQDGVADTTILS